MKKEKDPNHHELDDRLKDCLKFLYNKYEKEDGWVRKQQIKIQKEDSSPVHANDVGKPRPRCGQHLQSKHGAESENAAVATIDPG